MSPLKPQDVKRMGLNIGLCLLLLALGGGTVFVAYKRESLATQELQQANQRRTEAVNRLAKARDEAQEILDKTETYKSLRTRGVIGQEHRLEWIEQLKSVQKDRRLIDLQYEIAPQKPLDGETPSLTAGSYEIMTSPMKAQLQLLHEEDLLRFVDDLSQRVQAHIRVRRCTLLRLPAAARTQGAAPQLGATCDIDWITLRERS